MSIDTKALKAMIEGSGLSYRQNTVSWIFTCPRCMKRDKLYLRKHDGRFVCWVCKTTEGFEGHAEYALRELLNISITELKKRLYGVESALSEGPFIRLELHDFYGDDDEVPDVIVPPTPMLYPLDFLPIGEPGTAKGVAYLARRGVGLELAQKYALHYHPQTRRVIFPIVVDDVQVGWQGRTIEKDEWTDDAGNTFRIPKILTPKGVDRDRCLMFQDCLRGRRHAVLCEGPIDAIKCHLTRAAVASMGKSVSRGQLQILRDVGIRRLYLAIDPDAAAELSRLCREFVDIDVYQMLVPPGLQVPRDYTDPSKGLKLATDFGDMSPEQVWQAFLAARPVHEGNVFLPPLDDPFTFRAVDFCEDLGEATGLLAVSAFGDMDAQ